MDAGSIPAISTTPWHKAVTDEQSVAAFRAVMAPCCHGAMTPESHDEPVEGLPQALYLLACDAEAEKLVQRSVIGHVLRAAVLVELAERGCIRDENGRVRPVVDRRTGEPVLDQALRSIAERKRPGRWKALINEERKQTVQAVEEALQKAGRITVEPRTWRYPRVIVRTPERVAALHEAVARTLHADVPVESVPPRAAALVALSATAQLPGALTGKERWQNKKRIKALTEQAGEAAPALKKVMDEMQIAASAAVVGAST